MKITIPQKLCTMKLSRRLNSSISDVVVAVRYALSCDLEAAQDLLSKALVSRDVVQRILTEIVLQEAEEALEAINK